MIIRKLRLRLLAVASLPLLALPFIRLAADDAAATVLPRDPKAWQGVLTADDLTQLVASNYAELKEDVASRSRFRRAAKRHVLTGKQIAVIGNIGSIMLSGESAEKAAALRQAGVSLSAAADKSDHGPAEEAAATIGKFPNDIKPVTGTTPADFEDLIETRDSMLLTNSAGQKLSAATMLEGDGLAKEAPAAANSAKMLAAWAVIWAGDENWNTSDTWAKHCADMRDASLALSKAFAGKDAAAARNAWERVGNTCTACHKDNGIVLDE